MIPIFVAFMALGQIVLKSGVSYVRRTNEDALMLEMFLSLLGRDSSGWRSSSAGCQSIEVIAIEQSVDGKGLEHRKLNV
jgi:hypothetical protein